MSGPVVIGDVVGQWRDAKASWRAMTRSVHRPEPKGLPAGGAAADWHMQSEPGWLRSMEIARAYERDEGVVNAALTRLTTNVCQRGFTIDPQTGDPEADAVIVKAWRAWADSPERCDAQGRHTFDELAALAFRSTVRDGDFFLTPLQSGRLKSYEAHRLRTPQNAPENCVFGIQLDEQRRPIRYLFTPNDWAPSQPFYVTGDAVPVEARDQSGEPQVFHIVRTPRVSQTRGVTWFAPSVDVMEISSAINFAMMVRQNIVSNYAIFNKRPLGFDPDGAAEQIQSQTRDEYFQGIQRAVNSYTPGTIIDGLPGEELVMNSPNVPNPEYFVHARLLLTFLAANLNIPVNVLLLDPSDTNFSGWRGAIDQARQEWQVLQQWLIDRLHRPVFRWFLRWSAATDSAMAELSARLGESYFAHEWKPAAWPYIEPQKDAAADDLIRQGGNSTRRRLYAQRGLSYDDEWPAVLAELESELRACMEITQRLNAEFASAEIGAPADWREVAAARGVLAKAGAAALSGMVNDPNAQAANQ